MVRARKSEYIIVRGCDIDVAAGAERQELSECCNGLTQDEVQGSRLTSARKPASVETSSHSFAVVITLRVFEESGLGKIMLLLTHILRTLSTRECLGKLEDIHACCREHSLPEL